MHTSFFADYYVVADVGVPVHPNSDKSDPLQDLVNAIFEIPNPLEELASVVGLTLLFSLFNSIVYINVLSYLSFSFCLHVSLCILFFLYC